ncbi:MAG: hypothetical protein Q8P35_01765 [Candidatus Yanofskybacteria bacterium]|nr:hypothetical protein [Candidatus Yanofskybacteria bacterium]
MISIAKLGLLAIVIYGVAARPAPEWTSFVFTRLDNSSVYAGSTNWFSVTIVSDDSPIQYTHSALSPDRTKLATVVGGDIWGGNHQLWLVDLNADIKTRIASELSDAGIGGVDWSPDGRLLYFSGKKIDSTSDIYIYNLDTATLTQLTFTADLHEADVSISEDGTLLTFAGIPKSVDAKSNIWISNVDGSQPRLVYSSPKYGAFLGSGIPLGAYDPEWSPDNQKVIFQVLRNDNGTNFGFGSADILITDINTKKTETFVSDGAIHAVPDWNHRGIIWMEWNESDNYKGLRFKGNNTRSRRLFKDAIFPKWIP